PGGTPLAKLLDAAGKLHAPLLPPFGLELTAYALRRSGLASLSPQLVDLLRWGRTLSTAKAAPSSVSAPRVTRRRRSKTSSRSVACSATSRTATRINTK